MTDDDQSTMTRTRLAKIVGVSLLVWLVILWLVGVL